MTGSVGAIARVLVVDVKGSAPRAAGTQMRVWADGFDGTIGGGRLEWDALKTARGMLATGQHARVDRYALGPALGQCCGGAVTLVTEVADKDLPLLRRVEGDAPCPDKLTRLAQDGAARPLLMSGWLLEPRAQNTQHVVVHGAGHVGAALASVLAPLPNLSVTVSDPRPEWLGLLDPRLHNRCPHAVEDAPLDAAHFILTHSHDRDLELCHRLLTHDFRFAGLIGSASKWARFQTRLAALGHSKDQIARITCPIGDPALGKHPQAIAVSAASGLLKHIARKDAKGTL